MPQNSQFTNILNKTGLNTTQTQALIDRFQGSDPPPLIENDFPFGFVIEAYNTSSVEEEQNPSQIISLIGNATPYSPFPFGGSQRITKTYYPGDPEPSMQILGPEETSMNIKGQLKAIKLERTEKGLGAVVELQRQIDRIRYTGQLCSFQLGTWKRWGFIESVQFDMITETRINYSINLNILGFRPPRNGKILANDRKIPIDLVDPLFQNLTDMADATRNIQDLAPASILDTVNAYVSLGAEVLSEVSNVIDSIFDRVGEIRETVDRVTQIIELQQTRARTFRRIVSNSDGFDGSDPIITKYEVADYYSSLLVRSNDFSKLLDDLVRQLNGIIFNIPLARHIVNTGDTWQKISVRHYNNVESWVIIPPYNDLKTTDPVPVGHIIDIPRES